ncbi:clavaminate synthase-like protein At3g21360 [Vitis riparia]|uniref:clavaminate synthase-like protein At3g21360 n=1 Tax=Vitis riparia TaxID=96939 RepID=UPI00155A2C8E|nr:clavaminate synthase-like protein At3g21360 [Vitis riparia]
MSKVLVESSIPHQRAYNTGPFPLVLTPGADLDHLDLSLLTQSIKAQKPWLNSLLHKAGAILLRGFPVNTASDFNDVVEAFDFEELPYIGGAAPRNKVVGRIFTANEAPPDQRIEFHHEMAQVSVVPSKLFFFCEVEPGSGGETPIALSHVIYERMKEKYPEFVQKLEDHGLIYIRRLADQDDLSSVLGRGWKSTFLTDDKTTAEKRAAQVGTKLEWTESGVNSIMGPIAGIRYDEGRQRKVWFNSIVLFHSNWKDKGMNDSEKTVSFGNGEALPDDIVEDCLKILHEECVAFPWQKGDVLLIDNWAALHSRRPYTPPRNILASLCK